MKFYQIISDYFEDGQYSYATLAEAKREAREAADTEGYDIEVCRVEMRDTKAAVIALANRRGWCIASESVFTAKAKPRDDQ